MLLWTAILLGLLGSLHCLGMCGPLALALPQTDKGRLHYLGGRLLYNVGRVFTYGFLGVLFGMLGQTFSLFGYQQTLSILIGCILLVVVILGSRFRHRLSLARPVLRSMNWLKSRLGRHLKSGTYSSLLVIGVLNGYLPCGLVYVALAGATATGTPMGGALYMAAFGAGTIPMMLGLGLASAPLQFRLQWKLQKAIPLALCSLAVLFILRGLSLGIPYVSPTTPTSASSSSCH